ncbi:SDR family NAD(P)-dependent oxidoreductase, partial [Vibrio parahaemolyticus]
TALWERVIEVDLTSPFLLTQAVAAGMLERGSGKIVFTASLLSFQGGINVP